MVENGISIELVTHCLCVDSLVVWAVLHLVPVVVLKDLNK
jgi:hypothetical protein